MKNLICLFCLLSLTGQAATLNVGTIKSYLDKTSGYVPYAAGFNGTQYLRRTSVPTGLSDSSAFTLGFWMDLTGGDGSTRYVVQMLTGTTGRFNARRTSTNTLWFTGANSAGTPVFDAVASGTYTAASPAGWVHILLAVDLSSTSLRHLYTNGVEDASVTWNTYDTAPGVIDFSLTSPDYYIAATTSGGSLFFGSLCELWFNDTYLNDITKFNIGGHPVSLGGTGQLPLSGVSPVLYFSQDGSGASWNNSASASTYTLTGTPSSPSPPP
jgi:hypothetical protein